MRVSPLVDAKEQSSDWWALEERSDFNPRQERDRAPFTLPTKRRLSLPFIWAALLSILAAVFLIAQCHVWSTREVTSSNTARRLAGNNNEQQGGGGNDESDQSLLSQICQPLIEQPQMAAAGQGASFPMSSAEAQQAQAAAAAAAAAEGEQEAPSKRKRKAKHLEEGEEEAGEPEAKLSKLAGGKEASFQQGLMSPQQGTVEAGGLSFEAESLLPGPLGFEEELQAFQDDVLSAINIAESPKPSSSEHSTGWAGIDLLDELLESQLEEWISDADNSSPPAQTPEAPGEQQIASEEVFLSSAKEQQEPTSTGKVPMDQESSFLHAASTSPHPIFEEGEVPETFDFPFDFSTAEEELPHLKKEDIWDVLGLPASPAESASEQSGEEGDNDDFPLDTLAQLLKEGGFLEDWQVVSHRSSSSSSPAAETAGPSQGAEAKESSPASQPEHEGPLLSSPEVAQLSEDSNSSEAGPSTLPSESHVSGTPSETASTSSSEGEESPPMVEPEDYETHLFYHIPTVDDPEPEKEEGGLAMSLWVRPRLNLAGALRPVQELLNKEHLDSKEARELINRSLTLVRFAYSFMKPLYTMQPSELCKLLGRRLLVADALVTVELALGSRFEKPYIWDDIVTKMIAPPVRWKRKKVPAKPRRTRSLLVEYLLRGLDIYRSGRRPSARTVVSLKRELLCYSDSPPEFQRSEWDPWREDDQNSSAVLKDQNGYSRMRFNQFFKPSKIHFLM